MKVLVTGARGFIGSSLCLRLMELKIPVIPYYNHHDTWEAKIFNQFLGEEITHIVHLAAKNFVPESWETPEIYIQTNVNSTLSLLEFSRKINAKFIFLSSYMYGSPQYLPIDEDHPISVLNPYALSKKIAEDICKFYSENYHIKVSILRVFNIYGPGQKPSFLIPHVLKQALSGEEIKVLDLTPKRDYLFISDLIDAILKILDLDEKFEIFNIGSGSSFSVEEIIKIIQEVLGTNIKVISKSEIRINEINDVYAKTQKIKQMSGWEAKINIKEGLRYCINDIKNIGK